MSIPTPTHSYQINHRDFTAYTPLHQEVSLSPHCNYLFDLSYLGGIEVQGERASEFLQGQLTCDVRGVQPDHMRQGALCNLKGRILALLDVIQWQGLHLILPNDLRDETQSSLAKTALLSRVSLKATTAYQVFGFYLQNQNDHIPFDAALPQTPHTATHHEDYYCYQLDAHHYIFLIKYEAVNTGCAAFPVQQWRGSLAWHLLQLQVPRVDIYPLSRSLFLPHRLDLQHQGYLSFDKGCYKGQEIIARTHYRAKLKHTLKLFTLETPEPLQSGQKILDSTTLLEIGELIDFCPLDDNSYLVAISALFDHSMGVIFSGHSAHIELKPYSARSL